MNIDIIGSGSAFSLECNTSSMRIESQTGAQWLIDCGPTIPRALWQRGLGINALDVMYFTHIHPDHCAGLPALLNQWHSFGRDKPLTIVCQPAQRPMLRSLVALASWPDAHCTFEIQWQDTQDHFVWRDWQISTAPTIHAMPNRAIRIELEGHRLFYSGDGRPTPDSEALMQGVDHAFLECAMLTPSETHGDLEQCLALAERLSVPHLWLYHCFDEHRAKIFERIQAYPSVELSHDGLYLDLSRADGVPMSR